MKRDKFRMPRSLYDTAITMPPEQRLRLLKAICDYGFDDKLPDFVGDELATFERLRADVDAINGGVQRGKR